MRAVSDIHFHIGTKAYTFEPDAVATRGDLALLPDAVTTRSELALLLPLFMALTQPRGAFDVESYLDEYALWHCFRPVE